MWAFFVEGGWSMWLILVLGVLLLGVSVRFAIRPDRAHIVLLVALGVALAAATMQGTVMDIGAVFNFLTHRDRVPDADFSRVLMQGLKESTRPGTFGGGLLVLAGMIAAIGAARLSRKPAA